MENELREIAEELEKIKYGELHITIRNGKIVSFTTIQSKLKKSTQRTGLNKSSLK